MTIRVLLIDDHQLMGEGIAAILAGHDDIDLFAHLLDPRRAVEVAGARKPDVILLDICMPGRNGIDTARELRERVPGARVIGVSSYDEPALVEQMLAAGVAGFVSKSSGGRHLLEAIRAVATGKPYFEGVRLPEATAERRLLTEREREYLSLVARDMKPADIAQAMDISVRTVNSMRSRLLSKLRLDGNASLVRWALLLGCGDDNAS